MSHGGAWSTILGVATVVTTGCLAGTRKLDPPLPPARAIPNVAMPTTPPEPGMSRVIVDVVDGPATLELKTRQPQGGWLPMCRTPCAIDLPPGLTEASFRIDEERGDYTQIEVPPGTSVYRRKLVERSGSPALAVGGYTLAYLGLVTILSSAVVTVADTRDGHAGRNTFFVGLGLTFIGGAMFYEGWPSERPGASTQFGLSP